MVYSPIQTSFHHLVLFTNWCIRINPPPPPFPVHNLKTDAIRIPKYEEENHHNHVKVYAANFLTYEKVKESNQADVVVHSMTSGGDTILKKKRQKAQ